MSRREEVGRRERQLANAVQRHFKYPVRHRQTPTGAVVIMVNGFEQRYSRDQLTQVQDMQWLAAGFQKAYWRAVNARQPAADKDKI